MRLVQTNLPRTAVGLTRGSAPFSMLDQMPGSSPDMTERRWRSWPRLLRRQRGLRLLPGLQHRQHLLGEQPQAAFADRQRRAAEAERDVQLEAAEQPATFLQPAQDLLGRAPAGGLHEAARRAFEPTLPRDLGLLLVAVIALHRAEMLAEEFVVVEIALDEFALVFPRLLLAFREVGAADAELGQHHL